MKNTVLSSLLLGAAAIAILQSCAEEPTQIKENLPGRWEITSALRDGQSAASLAELYYEFSENGQMNTNLPIASGASTYTIDGLGITQDYQGQEIYYQVADISDSTLILETELRDTRFTFYFRKGQPASE
ncbi:hypothetical protein [Phaeodactylibacter luteus]|uniref:Lipocalin-like domain-containing protein n=1 Tax=Phaeodactylibacter luteus TaxID=1564516 RepID=A0A5C6RM44_9BACT|nr:hypothetical protein [Phaeodactylibacter luteus]TXB63406.1 hypothetical protein FRY97_09550 [Phaeodactylibacter luteus]